VDYRATISFALAATDRTIADFRRFTRLVPQFRAFVPTGMKAGTNGRVIVERYRRDDTMDALLDHVSALAEKVIKYT